MKNIRNQRGITLIALVITIIVTLIIAGIIIGALLGDNGILLQAENAEYESRRATAQEKFDVAILASSKNYGRIQDELLVLEIERVGAFLEGKIDDQTIEYPAKVLIDGFEFTVDKDMGTEPDISTSEITVDILSGMIPVNIDSSGNVTKADKENTNNSWYKYEDSRWANVALVTNTTRTGYENADIGVSISDNDILAIYTWIPRYEYQIQAGAKTYQLAFQPNTAKSDGQFSGEFKTPDVFTQNGEELNGIWVAKYNFSHTSLNNIQDNTVYGVSDANGLKSVDNGKFISFSEEIGTEEAKKLMEEISSSGNVFGLNSSEADSIFMDESMQLAIQILAKSKYGVGEGYNGAKTTFDNSGVINLVVIEEEITVVAQGEINNFTFVAPGEDMGNTPPYIQLVQIDEDSKPSWAIGNGIQIGCLVNHPYSNLEQQPLLSFTIIAGDYENNMVTFKFDSGNLEKIGRFGKLMTGDPVSGSFVYELDVNDLEWEKDGKYLDSFTVLLDDENSGIHTEDVTVDLRAGPEYFVPRNAIIMK